MISVIVLNYNGFRHLEKCLSSLQHQTYPSYEVIMVDNGSTDESVDYVKKTFPEVRVIALDRNLGFCLGNNYAIHRSVNKYVALINNDTEADPNWLAESVKMLELYPEAGFSASRIRLFNHRTHLDTCGDLYFRTGYPDKRGWLMADGRQFEQAEWVWGACAGAAVYRRSMLDDIGLFDEDFFAYMEDIDLSFRAQLLGYKCIYAPSAIIYHKVSATSGRHSSQRLYWSHRNHWYVLIKNLPSSLWLRYLPQIVMAELLIFLSAFKNRQLRTFVGARIEVCRMTPKMLQKRKEIQQRCRVSIRYIDSLIRRDWFSFRLELKRREKEYQDQTNK